MSGVLETEYIKSLSDQEIVAIVNTIDGMCVKIDSLVASLFEVAMPLVRVDRSYFDQSRESTKSLRHTREHMQRIKDECESELSLRRA